LLLKNVSVGQFPNGTGFWPAGGSTLVRADVGRVGGCCAKITDNVASGADAAGLGNRLVPADVIAVHVRAHDVTNGCIGHGPDRGQELRAHLRELRIDDQHALVAELDRRVSARADDHVEVRPDLHEVHLHVVKVLLLCHSTAADGQQNAGNDGCRGHQHANASRLKGQCWCHLSGPVPGRRPDRGLPDLGVAADPVR
jgi:hypothetical protein